MRNPVVLPCSVLLRFSVLSFVLCWTCTARAATITVTNLADSGPGTLRERIATASPGDTINFGLLGKVTLSSQLTISKNLRIDGLGVSFTQISGNNSTRIFNITAGSVSINTMLISDGRVAGTNGAVGQNGEHVVGGGILISNGASLGTSAVIISNNVAVGGQGGSQDQSGSSGSGGNAFGGAVANYGTFTASASQLVGNSATGGQGGPVTDGPDPGPGGQGWGGAVYSEGTCNIFTTTVFGNRAMAGPGVTSPGTANGGGLFNAATLVVVASTIASNSATGSTFDSGGGIQAAGPVFITDSTIAANQADFGGGIGGGAILKNSILALNSAGSGPDGSGSFISEDFNLIQNTNGLSFSGATSHNVLNKDPLLTPLQSNGGGGFGFPTLTMAPLPGSPAIDQGLSGNSDQNSVSRPYNTSIPNAPGGNGADIGSVEVVPTTLVVLNNNDSGPGSLRTAITNNNGLGGGNIITFSNTVTGTITLSSAQLTVVAPAIIRGPGADLLTISANHVGRVFDIREPTQISGLAIRDGLITGTPGNQGQNAFDGVGGGIYNQSTLILSNCIVRSNTVIGGIGGERHLGTVGKGGKGLGGGLYNAGGNISLINCTFDGNVALGGEGGTGMTGDGGDGGNGQGAAICTFGGTNVFNTCTLKNGLAMGGAGGPSSGGSAGMGGQGYGAGVYSESIIAVFSSTIHNGSAVGGSGSSTGSGYGGGIYNVGTLSLFSSTIASNSATGSSFDFGGGLYDVGTLGATNCTIAGNQADFGGGLQGNVTAGGTIFGANAAGSSPDVGGTINSSDYNLLQTVSGANISGATGNFIVGQDPLLGSLQNNGGPTWTMALLPNSPAIDKGRSFGLITDQRGLPRIWDLPSVPNAAGGDGSDIGAFEFFPTPRLNILAAGNNNVILYWTTDAADYRLESITNLPPPNVWSNVNSIRTTVGNQIFVTNPASGPSQFYRLTFP
jgi:hypothetical protein